ncbi:MAG: SCO family protein [Chloroflexi bacterium]|nr:SCO family protein [Chloroflexota bacterium]
MIAENTAPQPSSPRRATVIVLVAIFVALTVTLVVAGVILFRAPTFRGTVIEPRTIAPGFTFTNQYRQTVRLEDYRGKIVLIYFGFTNCPDACPKTLGTWKSVYNALGAEAEQVRFLFISIDPKRDTPERMKEFLNTYNPNYVGLVGTMDTIDDAAQSYLVFKYADDEEAYTSGHQHSDSTLPELTPNTYKIYHSSLTYVVDRAGKIALVFPLDTTVQDVTLDLRILLKQ